MGPLTTTSYALLGLLVFDGRTDAAMTGYELKQRADRTLRFYWVAPAMSQVYTELAKLADRGLIATQGDDRATRYAITPQGQEVLSAWLAGQEAGFPVLKHPVALRLLMGHLSDPAELEQMLERYVEALGDRREELAAIRQRLGDRPEVRYPAMVADWGLAYYDSETDIAQDMLRRIRATT